MIPGNTCKMETINSPFRYPGGKFYARKLVLEHIPKHTVYVEPLCGGSSIFFAKEKVEKNIINDKDEELINCLIHIKAFPEKVAELVENIKPNKENQEYYKNKFKPKNNLERAARWFFLNRVSYSGIMKKENCYFGYGDKYSMRPENWRKHLLRTSAKLKSVKILNKDFEEVINNAPDGAFLFIDPPYFNRDQDKFYTHSFSKDDHKRLMEVLKKNSPRLKFLVTYDNDPTIKEMYSWVKSMMDKEWNYMIYRTDNQSKEKNGNNKKHNGKRYKGRELFITNYNSVNQTNLKSY